MFKIMETGNFKVLENVKINQNIICLIVSFVFLCYSKDNCCCHNWIYKWSSVLFIISFISVCISLVFYTFEYCRKKCIKARCHKLRYEYIKEQKEKGKINDANGGKIISW